MRKKPTYEELEQSVRELEKPSLEPKRADQALRESEEKYRTLADCANDAIVVVQEGKTIYRNPAYEKLIGYSVTETSDWSFLDVVAPEDKKKVQEYYQKRLKGEKAPEQYEAQLLTRDGRRVTLEVKARAIEYQGRPASMAIMRDITERKRADLSLRQSEERFRTQYENIPIPTYTWQRQGAELVLIDCNEAAMSISKGKIKKFIGQTASEFCHDDPDRMAELRECYEERKTIRNHMHYRLRSTGEWKYLDVTYVFVPPDLVMVHTEDVTDRELGEKVLREAHEEMEVRVAERTSELVKANEQLRQEIEERKWVEEALRESEIKYRTVLEASPDPVVVYDMEGKVVYVNPAFTHVFGWTLKRLLGKRIDYVPKENWPETQMLIERVLAGESFSGIQSRRHTKQRNIRDVSISVATYLDREGNPAGSIHTLRDITERKRLEEQLRHAQKLEAIGTLAGGVAHDFNNLLMGIQGNVSLMLMDIDRTHPHCERLRNIEEQVQSGARLTVHLLGYARKGKYEVKPIDVKVQDIDDPDLRVKRFRTSMTLIIVPN